MIKDLLVAFVIALAIGSFMNGWNASDEGGGMAQDTPTSNAQVDTSSLSKADESNFQNEVIDASTPVLVDFYADACPHCRNMVPVLAEVATEKKGILKVVKVDAMANPALAQKYGIGPLPGFVVFKGGKAVESFVGEMPKSQLLSTLSKYTGTENENHGA